ncbi:ferredoxin [Nocardioides sp. zg-579]|uniref:Ferredoxin n=1 Tax=Nocardioides marmotae TaxID=2663857 RepID=A0A6I3J967_9ACTN|nr:ferredoxin [Nocardioides marmotae]MCR6030097.1 ferredoxin [Gordonia jinghuaiqii]MTB93728.1 ferredoxin [Nocardioides marmotae]QKE00072.1 ferredoxin [Nocardioides marmotae]
MKILLDPAKCVSAGTCVTQSPELYDQDDEGIVVALVESPEPAQFEAARRGAVVCPAGAIVIEED